jgi:hypothetical protein
MPFHFKDFFGWAKRTPRRPRIHQPEPFDVLTPDKEAEFLLGGWVQLTSHWIREARYQDDARILEIRIEGGAFYQRFNVSEKEAEDFLRAPSHGEWVWRHGWRTGEFLRVTSVSPPRKR